MNVGAVSDYSYSYSTSIQYQYFGTVVSNQRIQELMEEYGIEQSTDTTEDLQALYQAMYATASQDVSQVQDALTREQSSASAAQTAQNVPWADVMSQVGLTPTGNLEEDEAAFNTQVSIMFSSAITPQDKASVAQIDAQGRAVFSQQTSDSSSQIQSGDNAPTTSGADLMAVLNKLYFFG